VSRSALVDAVTDEILRRVREDPNYRDELRAALGVASADRGEYLSTRQAADLAAVAAGTIRRWIKAGRLPPLRAGREVRIRRADLEHLLSTVGHDCSLASPEELADHDFHG
jgi:excisionase family DNA binding protein